MNRFIDSCQDETFDMLVIGGGITGACVAYDAACRGLKVALVEKGDFGRGDLRRHVQGDPRRPAVSENL